jgi:dATP pyrophosphohydrolase
MKVGVDMRAPYQVLVFPYYISDKGLEYAIFRRSDAGWWQAISGGGEDGETIIESAKREAWKEGGISMDSLYMKLETVNSIPAEEFADGVYWDENIYVIPENCYGVEIINKQLTLSNEHTEYRWMSYNDAISCLKGMEIKWLFGSLTRSLVRKFN